MKNNIGTLFFLSVITTLSLDAMENKIVIRKQVVHIDSAEEGSKKSVGMYEAKRKKTTMSRYGIKLLIIGNATLSSLILYSSWQIRKFYNVPYIPSDTSFGKEYRFMNTAINTGYSILDGLIRPKT